jgi:fibronectin-binding autotransporter adhesin
MSRRISRRVRASILIAAIPMSFGACGLTVTNWSGNSTNNPDNLWNDSMNWTNGVATTGYTAQFNSPSTNSTISLGGTVQDINTISFVSGAGAYSLGVFGSGDQFTFDAGGFINLSAGATSQTINANIAIASPGTMGITESASFTLNINGNISLNSVTNSIAIESNGTTDITGAISGTGGLIIQKAGVTALSGSNTYSGLTTVNGASTVDVNVTPNVTSGFTYGPYGTGVMSIGNATNPHLQAVGANQILYNPIFMKTGFISSIASGDTANSLTLAGQVTNNGSFFITNNPVNAPGAALVLGLASSPSTLTASSVSGDTLSLSATDGPIIVNDAIQNGGGANNVSIDAQNNGYAVTMAGASTYSGNTTYGSATNTAQGALKIGSSTVGAPGSVTSGPFGTGTLIIANSTLSNLQPVYANQIVANAITVSGTGFTVSTDTNDLTGTHSLTLSAPLTLGGKAITNNLAVGGTLYLGAATSPSTVSLTGATLSIENSGSATASTVINDLISDGSGSGVLDIENGSFVTLTNASNSYSGGSVINGGTLSVSSDGNLGNSGGAVTINGGSAGATLLSTGTFSSARTVNLNGSVNVIDATGTNVLTLTGTVGSGDLTKGTNSGTLQLAQSAGFSIAGNINVNGGTLLVGPTGGETGPLSVGNTLTVNSGALAAIATGVSSNSVTNSVSTLTLNGSGQFDLANSNLITSTPSNTIRQYLINGYNGGAWNGTGGISSVNANASYNIPASNGGHFTALGYTSGTSTVGAALGLTAGQTLVKYTIYGDANLDGTVDINDLNIVLSNFLSGNPATWDTGDFFYAGQTDISDLNAVLSNFFDTAPTTVRAANAAAKFKASTASTAKTLTGTVSPADTVSPPPANGVLELVVNTTSGDVELEGNNADIASLQITSASSSIITANWTDLHANGYTNWSDTAKKKTGIGEYDNQFTATGDYAVLGVVDYGDIYNTSVNAEDYVFKYGSVESNDTTVDTDTGSVIYVQPVPEPTTLGLMGLAAAGLLGRRRKLAKAKKI